MIAFVQADGKITAVSVEGDMLSVTFTGNRKGTVTMPAPLNGASAEEMSKIFCVGKVAKLKIEVEE